VTRTWNRVSPAEETPRPKKTTITPAVCLSDRPANASIAADLRRRAAAALRMTSVPAGQADPLRCMVEPHGQSSFGLTFAELTAEVRRCHDSGWQVWELHARFTVHGSSDREVA
jgi:hypothetical protein